MTVQSGKNTVIEEVQGAGKHMDQAANPEAGQMEARDWGAQAGSQASSLCLREPGSWEGRGKGRRGKTKAGS